MSYLPAAIDPKNASAEARTRHRAPFVKLWLAVLLLAASPAPIVAKAVQAPDSRVVINLPDGFETAKRFKGFQHPSGASVVILEVPASAYDKMARGMNANALARRGITNVEPLKLDRKDKHTALKAEQRTIRGVFEKLILLLGDGEGTALITANLPRLDGDTPTVEASRILAAFEDIRLGQRSPPPKPLYTFRETGPLKKAGSLAGAGQIYNETGTLPRERIKKSVPTFIAVHALNQLQVPSPSLFAAGQFEALSGFKDKTLTDGVKTRIAGMEAHIHRGTATSTGTGDRVQLFHAMIFPPAGGYYRFIGTTPEAKAGTFMPVFQKMAESFELAK